jgi:hypothetical protein
MRATIEILEHTEAKAIACGHPNTYGDIITEGKCWDALPLSIRRLIVSHTNLDRNTELRSWGTLSDYERESLYPLDWHEIYSNLDRS